MIYINGRFLTQKLTGVQRYAFEMTKRLSNNYKNELCILIPPAKINESYEIDNLQIKTIGKITNTFWEQIDLPLYLNKKNKPLLINLVNTAPCFYKNQIACIMDMTIFVNPGWFNKTFVSYYKIILPLIGKNSKKIITISENSKKDIIKYLRISPQKIEIISPAVSAHFSRNKIKDFGIFIKLGVAKNKYILAVSSLDPRKNFKRLIEAYSLLQTDIPLVIVGAEGKVFAKEKPMQLLNNEKDLIFTGYINDNDLFALYKFAAFFVYPSLYEGFGIPPLEAMASGCATIVSNISSLPEVCGNASLYVDPESVESIKQALLMLLNNKDLKKELEAKGEKQVKKFSWYNSAQKLMDIVNEMKAV